MCELYYNLHLHLLLMKAPSTLSPKSRDFTGENGISQERTGFHGREREQGDNGISRGRTGQNWTERERTGLHGRERESTGENGLSRGRTGENGRERERTGKNGRERERTVFH